MAQRRQVFYIDMDEAGWSVGLEGDGRRRLREAGGPAVALEAAVHAAAREFGVEAAPHRLDDSEFKRLRSVVASSAKVRSNC
jgi:hypothetical protein